MEGISSKHPSDTHTTESSKIYCKHVAVRSDQFGGDGAFATKDFVEGELVEKGLIRLVEADGHTNVNISFICCSF